MLRRAGIGVIAGGLFLAVGLWSPTVSVAAQRLSFHAPRRVRAQGLIVFTGRLAGGASDAVVVQRQTGRRWRNFAVGHAGAGGQVALTAAAPLRRGRVVVRAVGSTGRHVVAVSATRTIRVLRLPKGLKPVVVSSRRQVLDAEVVSAAPPPGKRGKLRYFGGNDIHRRQIVAIGPGRATPDGFLGQVTKVTYRHEQTIVSTRPATLEQAVPSGSLNATLPMPAARAARTSITPHWDVKGVCAGTTIGSINPNVSLGAGINLKADWSLFGGLQSVRLTANASADASLTASVAAAGGCKVEENVPYDEPYVVPGPTWFGLVGFVPVVITTDLRLISFGQSALVGGAMSAAADAGFSASAGIGWDKNRGFFPIASFQRHFSFTPPTINSTATLEADVTPGIDVLLYGIAGPEIGLTSGLKFAAATAKNPWWTLSIPIKFSGSIAIPVLGLRSPRLTIFTHEFPIAHASGPFGVSVTVIDPGAQTTTAGTPVSLQIHASDTDGGTLKYAATGLPPGLSINSATGLITGTPTTAGTYAVALTATDASGPSNTVLFSWTINAAPVSFVQAVSYPMPSSENADRVGTGALAGGSLDDIVTGDTNGNVTVFLNHGDGTFAPGVDYATGSGTVTGIAIADVNGDGKQDVTATTQGSGGSGIFIFLGDGKGGLEAPYSVPNYDGGSGDSPTSLAVGNFFHDGRVALATGGSSSGANPDVVRVFSNDGTGHFTLADTIRIGSTYTSTSWLHTADLTGTGSSDIVASAGGNTVTGCGGVIPLINNGSGGFSDAGALPNICSAPKVATADFNLDGHTDIVAADSCDAGGFCGAAAQVERVYFGAGDGTFPSSEDNSIPAGNPGSAVAADLNGSGHSDLVVACSGSCTAALQVLMNNGDGTFTAGPELTGDTQDMAAGRFTSSSLPDLATVGYDLRVLLNTTP